LTGARPGAETVEAGEVAYGRDDIARRQEHV
jgi:hypothetical protein